MLDPYYFDLAAEAVFTAFGIVLILKCLIETVKAVKNEVFGADTRREV
jgi:hypothetical protein